jgi:hypothetical protein
MLGKRSRNMSRAGLTRSTCRRKRVVVQLEALFHLQAEACYSTVRGPLPPAGGSGSGQQLQERSGSRGVPASGQGRLLHAKG